MGDVNEEFKEVVGKGSNKVDDTAGKAVSKKSVEQLADEVDAGIHGSGRERMIVLGDDYEAVQRLVNLRAKGLK